MPEPNSLGYYQARELKQRTLARAATDPAIAAIHLDMAARYAAIIQQAPRVPPPHLMETDDARTLLAWKG